MVINHLLEWDDPPSNPDTLSLDVWTVWTHHTPHLLRRPFVLRVVCQRPYFFWFWKTRDLSMFFVCLFVCLFFLGGGKCLTLKWGKDRTNACFKEKRVPFEDISFMTHIGLKRISFVLAAARTYIFFSYQGYNTWCCVSECIESCCKDLNQK